MDIKCSQCGKVTRLKNPDHYCNFGITCKSCGNKMRYAFSENGITPLPPKEKEVSQDTARVGIGFNPHPGIIRVRKSWLFKMFGQGAQQMQLKPGANYIGRYNSIEPSDFSLSDRSVSRRSLRIDVSFDAALGYKFKLNVLKAANPVYRNGHQLQINEVVELKYNDIIKVGKTMLEFVAGKN